MMMTRLGRRGSDGVDDSNRESRSHEINGGQETDRSCANHENVTGADCGALPVMRHWQPFRRATLPTLRPRELPFHGPR
jgi:hypothetical protein